MNRVRSTLGRRSFWILASILAALTYLHYLTPQERSLPSISHPFGRHAVERIIFVLPIAGATFAFGQAGGVIVLVLTLLAMLPRAFFLSPYPADSILETVAVGVVGYLVIWMIETQQREKRLRQAVASRLTTINAITHIVTSSLEMEQILNGALNKVTAVTGMEVALAYLLDRGRTGLTLTAWRGLTVGEADALARLDPDDNLARQVVQAGEAAVVDGGGHEPGVIACLAGLERARSLVAVPLRSSSSVMGILILADPRPDPFARQDVQLLTAIGGQIGVAVENARLYESMRYYTRQVTRAQEEERKRIARDLHDETIQTLIAAARRIEGLTTSPGQPTADTAQQLAGLRALISDALKGLRRFVRDLRPPALDHLGLTAALASLAADLGEKSGIETDVKIEGHVRRLTPDQELGLFRIFQEALNNVRRHSGASHVSIRVTFLQERVLMIIQDNGCGFTAPTRSDGLMSAGNLGLIGMIERARLLEGAVTIGSQPGQGTSISVDVPA